MAEPRSQHFFPFERVSEQNGAHLSAAPNRELGTAEISLATLPGKQKGRALSGGRKSTLKTEVGLCEGGREGGCEDLVNQCPDARGRLCRIPGRGRAVERWGDSPAFGVWPTGTGRRWPLRRA